MKKIRERFLLQPASGSLEVSRSHKTTRLKTRDAGARQTALIRIQSKHVDFVLCDPATMAAEYVVELDKKSHKQSKWQSRDAFVDEALAAAGIRVVHMPATSSYSVENIRKAFVGS